MFYLQDYTFFFYLLVLPSRLYLSFTCSEPYTKKHYFILLYYLQSTASGKDVAIDAAEEGDNQVNFSCPIYHYTNDIIIFTLLLCFLTKIISDFKIYEMNITCEQINLIIHNFRYSYLSNYPKNQIITIFIINIGNHVFRSFKLQKGKLLQ